MRNLGTIFSSTKLILRLFGIPLKGIYVSISLCLAPWMLCSISGAGGLWVTEGRFFAKPFIQGWCGVNGRKKIGRSLKTKREGCGRSLISIVNDIFSWVLVKKEFQYVSMKRYAKRLGLLPSWKSLLLAGSLNDLDSPL